jgi:RNA polymerase sigma factor (sigma-70 family)
VDDRDEDFDAAFPAMLAVAVGMARRILLADPAVEDVAAEALARTYARWDRLAGTSYRDAWISRVTANLALDRRRRPLSLQPSGGSSTALDERVIAGVVVRDALRRLPRRQREAVALCLLADCSEEDAARAMRVSTGTVKTHLHRGREALRAALGADFAEVAHARP